FISEFCLDLIEVQRHLPIGADFAPEQISDHFLMSRPQAELALVAILEADQFFAVETPSAGFSPQLCGRRNRHEKLLGSGPVHLLTNDLFDLSNDPEAEREVCIDAGCHLANQAGAEHEPMADSFCLARVFSQCRD